MIKLTPEELRKILEPNYQEILNIGVLFLAVPNGKEIAQVFAEYGVKHIFIINSPFKNLDLTVDGNRFD